jgi:hypothetical protein
MVSNSGTYYCRYFHTFCVCYNEGATETTLGVRVAPEEWHIMRRGTTRKRGSQGGWWTNSDLPEEAFLDEECHTKEVEGGKYSLVLIKAACGRASIIGLPKWD